MTAVGEQGMSLSSTQKLKIALARLLLCNPRVVVFDIDFVLDSETDLEFRQIVLDVVVKMAKKANLVVVAVTHHPDMVRIADVVCHIGQR